MTPASRVPVGTKMPMTEKHVAYLEEARNLAWHANDLGHDCGLPSCEHLREISANIQSQVSGDMVLVPRAEAEIIGGFLIGIRHLARNDAEFEDAKSFEEMIDRWLSSSSDTLSSKKGE